MKKMNIIEDMDDDHLEIVKLFNSFFSETKNKPQRKDFLLKQLEELKWHLERHILVEENEVFTKYPLVDEEDREMINRLNDEHKEILSRLDQIKENLLKNQEIDVYGFRSMWVKHELYERETFYPLLDKALTDKEKDNISQKIQTRVK